MSEPDYWNFDLMLPIHNAAGQPITDFRSAAAWSDTLREPDPSNATTGSIAFNEFVSETHHHYYGRPWIMGQFYFEELLQRGIHRKNRVLDFGCGAGRLGIKLIPFLDEGNYYGVDSHLRSLVAFASYEARLHGLFAKRPHLMISEKFEIEKFGAAFDVVLDFATTLHISIDQARIAYSKIHRSATRGARVFTSFPPKLGIDGMKESGFDLTDRRTITYRVPAPAPSISPNADEWYEFVVS